MSDKDIPKSEHERKMAVMRQFLDSEAWKILKEDFLKQALSIKQKTDNMMLDCPDEKGREIIALNGFRIGVEWCLTRPQYIKDDNEKFLDRMIKKVFGEVKK